MATLKPKLLFFKSHLRKSRHFQAAVENCKERDGKRGRRFRPSMENGNILQSHSK